MAGKFVKRGTRAGTRVTQLAGTAVLVLGSVAALAGPAQAGVARAGRPQAGATAARSAAGARLWHPTAFGRDPWVSATAGPTAVPATTPATAPGAAGVWTPERTPNPAGRPNGVLLAESCGAAQACEAVGDYFDNVGHTVTLAEQWTGGEWAIQATPALPGTSSSQLTGVSCLSASSCTAVGYDTDHAGVIVPLAETWNGTRWAIQAAPAPSGSSASGFLAVSCTSASACTAVGDNTVFTGASLPLAERWNGTSWSVQAIPNPGDSAETGLFAVSCAAATACIATGSSAANGGTPEPLSESWNGSAWKIKAVARPAGATGGELTGVSCTAAAACTAAGYAANSEGGFATLAVRWNGTGWSVQATPVPAGSGYSALSAVSCTSATACTAAGAYVSKTGMPTLAEAWNGTSWSIQRTPSLPGTRGSQFNAISCTSPGRCTAVGQQADSVGNPTPLGEARTGAQWVSVVTPAPTGAKTSALSAVSCPAADACTAVGNTYQQTSAPVALAEAWNGSRWSIQHAALPIGSNNSYLQGVSCATADACTAVGSYSIRGDRPSLPLAEAWNGTSWSIQAVPVPAGSRQTTLYAVSCSSARACTAIGVYHNRGGQQEGLAERWDGTSWTIQDLGTAGKGAFLSGVSCPAVNGCVAAGYATGTGDAQPLALAWDGSSWQTQQVPLPPAGMGGAFSAVSCTSTASCMATGTVFARPGGSFAEYWNGTSWHNEPAPNPPNGEFSMGQITLTAVSCTSPGACAAVGEFTPNGQPEVYAEAWNGTVWRLRPIRLPGGTDESFLSGTSCATAGCTAVGSHVGDSNVQVTMALGTTQTG